MGPLHEARDRDSGESVVIAIAAAGGESGGHTARMRREAQTLARLEHPNLHSIRDVGALDGRLYLIMDPPSGDPIDRYLEVRACPWPTVLELYCDAGRGLAAAHTRAIVHGQVAPAHILVDDDGRVRLTGFALVRTRTGVNEPAATDGPTRDQPPEVAAGAPATLFGDQYSFASALAQALEGAPRGSASALPRHIRRALERARAPAPSNRYPSMYELLDDLQRTAPSPRVPVPMLALAIAVAATVGWLLW